jgi:manganese/zinc/iron transport system permease protein
VSRIAVGLALLLPAAAQAARIGDLAPGDAWTQATRFFTLRDPALRAALLGSVLLGLNCGLLGGFMVVRRLALLGDTLAHAVLPGVAAGFLWTGTKNPLAILVGATLAGLLGSATMRALTRTTRLKEDAALGLVLSTFFAVGMTLVTMLQRLPNGAKSGIDQFLFGQAAALGPEDLILLGATAATALLILPLCYHGLLATSFDPAFARSAGLPALALNTLLLALITVSVVSALQAVGVVLVSALLVIPAAAAYLLTDRFHRLLLLSALIGVLAGGLGAFASFLDHHLPTGPLMVLAAAGLFALAFLGGPRHGLLPRAWRQRAHAERIQAENVLKTVHALLEENPALTDGIPLPQLAARRQESAAEIAPVVRTLRRLGWAEVGPAGDLLRPTPTGLENARRMVRNHRLWELYLTTEARFDHDHVHDNAEEIEHVLGEETVRELERRLGYPARDPHGKPIPGRTSATP